MRIRRLTIAAALVAATLLTSTNAQAIQRIAVGCAHTRAPRLCSVRAHWRHANQLRHALGRPAVPLNLSRWHYPARRSRILTAYTQAHRRLLLRYMGLTITATPVALGQHLAAQHGWTGNQWTALYTLWNRESGWRPTAYDSSSGACGIPQFVPCRDWGDTHAQLIDGIAYIAGRYGSPAAALAHSDSYGWY